MSDFAYAGTEFFYVTNYKAFERDIEQLDIALTIHGGEDIDQDIDVPTSVRLIADEGYWPWAAEDQPWVLRQDLVAVLQKHLREGQVCMLRQIFVDCSTLEDFVIYAVRRTGPVNVIGYQEMERRLNDGNDVMNYTVEAALRKAEGHSE